MSPEEALALRRAASWGGRAAALAALGAALLAALWVVWAAAFLSFFDIRAGFRSGRPTTAALEAVPDRGLLTVFQEAERRFGVSWAVLAAVAEIESGFGRGREYLARRGVSPAGAVGFMQFMPTTWSGASNPLARDDPASPSWDEDPARIAQHGGYGCDGDGDGRADPYNPWDAVFAAARFLAANGFAEDPRRALYLYNRSWAYVRRVLARAAEFSSGMLPAAEGAWPLPPQYGAAAVTSRFGEPRGGRVHMGIDVACPEGTPVFSVLPGAVAFAGWRDGYGLCVVVESPGAVTAVYAHLSRILVAEGQPVARGQALGLSGSTGSSTGPHLHFEARVNNRPCDPLEWLRPPGENY